MNELALFAGAGGGILGSHLLGWRTVCAVEINPYARAVLAARQNDGTLRCFPIWDDVSTFDGLPWRGCVDVISGGFPCQDISVAGGGAGLDGERSGLWREFARIIREVRPRFVFVENSPALTGRGLGRVLGDLASLGYDAQWGVLGAADVGAPHKRDRIWIVANSDRVRQLQPQGGVEVQRRRSGDCGREMGDAAGSGLPLGAIFPLGRPEPESKPQRPSSEALGDSVRSGCEELNPTAVTERPGFDSGEPAGWWAFDPGDDPESGVGRVVNGLAYRVDRIAALGNGQVPAVAATAFTQLKELT